MQNKIALLPNNENVFKKGDIIQVHKIVTAKPETLGIIAIILSEPCSTSDSFHVVDLSNGDTHFLKQEEIAKVRNTITIN
jgi:hypothetical protein